MLKMEEEEMEEEASQYGSGCESGWTMYLGQSHESSTSPLNNGDVQEVDQEEEEESLSMISDASSGPPHPHEDDECCCCHHLSEKNSCFFSASSSSSPAAALQHKCWKRRRVEAQQQSQRQVANTHLDDTASSPFLGFSGNVRRLLFHQQDCNFTTFGIPDTSLCGNKAFVEEALEFSYEFSATYLKGKTTFQKPLHYIKPTSPKPVRKGEVGKKIRWEA